MVGAVARQALASALLDSCPHREASAYVGHGDLYLRCRFDAIGPDGIAELKLEPTAESGEVVLNLRFDEYNDEEINAWLEAPLRDSDSDNPLVVVGALHLLGDDGLVRQLARKGYRVQRLR